MTTLNDVRDALADIDPNVYYGTAAKLPKGAPWNYIVFSRSTMGRSPGRTGMADGVEVAIVREEYIPDGLAEAVVEAVEAIPGMRQASGDARYYYDVRPGTTTTCEMLLLDFTRARRR